MQIWSLLRELRSYTLQLLSPHTLEPVWLNKRSHRDEKPVHHNEDLAQPKFKKKWTKKQIKQNKQNRESAFGQMPKAVLVYCDQLTVNTRKRWISGFRFEACILLVQSFIQVCTLSHFSPVWLFVTLWTVARQAPLSVGFSRQESFLQGTFPACWLNPHYLHLLHW